MKRSLPPTTTGLSQKTSNSTITLSEKDLGHFRASIACCFLSKRAVRMTNIRATKQQEPGLTAGEVVFAKAATMLTNGSILEINETGTTLLIRPGLLQGGEIDVECPHDVHMGWIVQGLLPLLPFCKHETSLRLKGGITDSDDELAADVIKVVSMSLLGKFLGSSLQCSMEITKRATRDIGGGELVVLCHPVKTVLTIPRTDTLACESALVWRIRGVAFAVRVSPQMAHRASAAARRKLENICQDVYISTDARTRRGGTAGESPGYGCALWAELVQRADSENNPSPKVISYLSSCASVDETSTGTCTPEAVGEHAATELLLQIAQRGVVDSSHQSLLIMLMALCPPHVVRGRIGKELTSHAIGTLRCIQDFLGLVFKLEKDESGHGILVSCVGSGVTNVARRVT